MCMLLVQTLEVCQARVEHAARYSGRSSGMTAASCVARRNGGCGCGWHFDVRLWASLQAAEVPQTAVTRWIGCKQ